MVTTTECAISLVVARGGRGQSVVNFMQVPAR
jgi:hypothetical protein